MGNKMEKIMEAVVTTYEKYVGSSWHMVLLAVAAVFILFFAKEKKYKIIFSGYVILFGIIYLCPFTAWIIIKTFIGRTVYWRMFWSLPSALIIAYGCSCLLGRIPAGWVKALTAIACVVCISVTGKIVVNMDIYDSNTNRFKLPAAVPGICELIKSDAQQQGLEVVKVVACNSLVSYIRQYDASILMPYGRNALRQEGLSTNEAELFELFNQEETNYERLNILMTEEECNYFIVSDTAGIKDKYLAKGYQPVGEIEVYTIFRTVQ